jgi:hypothetical protein
VVQPVASTTPAIPKHQQRGCFTAPMQVRHGYQETNA